MTGVSNLMSYVPFVGGWLANNQSEARKQASSDDRVQKLLHQDASSTWNTGLYSKLKEFGTWLYGSVRHKSLMKLFLIDDTVPGLDPKQFPDYDVHPIEIKNAAAKATLSKKYIIEKPGKANRSSVLFHGVRTTGRNLGRISKTLADGGHRVYVGDSAGFGINKGTNVSEHTLIEDHVQTIKQASIDNELGPINIVAHSMGSALATKAVERIFTQEAKTGNFNTKIDNLVLVSPWDQVSNLITDFYDSDQDDKLRQVKNSLGENDNVSGVLKAPQDSAKAIAKSVFGVSFDTIASLFEILMLNDERPDEAKIKNIQIVHGKNDPFVSYQRSKNLIDLVATLSKIVKTGVPNARFVLVEDGNHFDAQADSTQDRFPSAIVKNLLNAKFSGIQTGKTTLSSARFTPVDTKAYKELAASL